MNEANAYSVESYLASNSLIKQVLALSKYYTSSCLCINAEKGIEELEALFCP